MKDFKDGDQTATHCEAKDTSYVGHEPNQGNLLVTFHLEL